MNLIWVLLIFGAFLSITDGVKLRPKPNWKPLYHRKTAISRWGRFHSMSGVDHDKGHQKMYPKKFGPTPASCHVDCHYDYQTSYNIPLKADEDFCPPFIRTRLVNIDFYEATNWQHICFAPNVTLCTYCLEIQTLREYGQIEPNRQNAMHLRQSCQYFPPENGCTEYMDLQFGDCQCQSP